MSHLHRIIAALLILVLVPATVLAGPMRLCLGQDGHRKIEFIHGGHQTSGIVDGATTKASDHIEAPSPMGRSCIDLALLTESPSPHAVQKSTLGGGDPQPLLAFLVAPPDIIGPAAPHACDKPATTSTRDPRLEALRTVILLI